ncbi:DNA-3-methyladenine glycosylase family protein [Longispora albida]|uniref:DNA-3-methyladenine glycosylase family protein n=1 Tax=Longispora albida TaxID=203523 RepID=UPI00036CC2C8|nr:hypothetical protein [Longispora albida]
MHRTLAVPDGYQFSATVGQLPMGGHDPCARFAEGAFWLAARTPDGPGSVSLRQAGLSIEVEAYGAGASWLLDRAGQLAGLSDDLGDFAELAQAHPLVAELARLHRGHRLPATGQVFPRVLRAVFEQKVTGKEAYHAYSGTVRKFSERAPGPHEALWLPPDPAVIAAAPYWEFHPLGVEQRRADTLRRAAAEASRLERCSDTATATKRLLSIAGIGPWTAAEVVRASYGDADAVSVGDYHLPNTVAWALAGEARADDRRMLELLAPFAGHRARVCALLGLAGIGAPRRGPRMPLRSFARY